MELLTVDTIKTAREKLTEVMKDKGMDTLVLNLLSAQGYILSKNIVSNEMVPAFRRSTVDGYAVLSKDTIGATEGLPVFLTVLDEVLMGSQAKTEIHSGECVYVPTGGMIPDGADAVIMIEYCELVDSRQTAVYHSIAYGKNIVQAGEDIEEGELVLKKGTRIGPNEIGVLACLGIHKVEVFRPWKLTIISTGDELVSIEDSPSLGKIRDINTYTLYANGVKHGFEVINTMVLPDEECMLKKAMTEAMKQSDLVIISGGSSQGKKDTTKKIIDEVASMGSFTHGLALKPGKPTIIGFDEKNKVLLFGLPGHPVAAVLVFDLVITWLWRTLTNQQEEKSVFAKISSNLAGAPGKMTCQLVKLSKQDNDYYAEPIFGKSGLITTLTSANGYILIDQNKEGLNRNELVEVFYL